MKVIDLETIESEEVRQKIQNITDTVSRELIQEIKRQFLVERRLTFR